MIYYIMFNELGLKITIIRNVIVDPEILPHATFLEGRESSVLVTGFLN